MSPALSPGSLRLAGLWALACLALAGSEARLSLAANGEPAQQVVASLNALADWRLVLDEDLLDAQQHLRPVVCQLRQADRSTAAEILASAMGVWWYVDAEDSVRFTTRHQLPAVGPLAVSTIDTQLPASESLASQFRQLLAPWLGDRRGLDYLPSASRWAATLDAEGEARLRRLLTVLQTPAAEAPLILPHPDRHPDSLRLQPLPAAATLAAQIRDLAAQLRLSVACDAHLAGLAPPDPKLATDLGGLRQRWRRHGVDSRYLAGCLYLARNPALSHRHPRQNLELAVAPLTQPQRRLGQQLLERLRARVRPAAWQQPGAGLLLTISGEFLIIQAEIQVLAAVLDELRLPDW